jgi:hypothetical protein
VWRSDGGAGTFFIPCISDSLTFSSPNASRKNNEEPYSTIYSFRAIHDAPIHVVGSRADRRRPGEEDP